MNGEQQIKLAANALKENSYCITSLLELNNKAFSKITALERNRFKDSWSNLEIDNHMSDNGKYRYRRYSVINCYNGNKLEYLPSEPHYQKKYINNLNGDILRYYADFEEYVLKSSLLSAMIMLCCKIFNHLSPENLKWRVECHQFRIIPSNDKLAFPTPEGRHRDGVDYVFMMLMKRKNITGGITKIYSNDDVCIATHMMKYAEECILLDDSKVMHEVSPINNLLANLDGYRDMLVLTFRSLTK